MSFQETTEESKVDAQKKSVVGSIIKEITEPFINLFKVSQASWGINISYLLEGLTYFGVVGLLVMYFNIYTGLDDISAGRMVGVLTAGITLSMLFLGAAVDIIGVRRAILWSLFFMLIGRVLLTIAPYFFASTGIGSSTHLMAMAGILGIVVGYGIYQPACYAAVKQFTTEKTAAMGYAMLYALMNLGGFLPGLISPPVRRWFSGIEPSVVKTSPELLHKNAEGVGITGVFWVYAILTVVGMVVIAVLLTKKAIKDATLTDTAIEKGADGEQEMSAKEKMKYYIKNFPLRDLRFLYFIFILIPVQTLFAHNWLTLPVYFARAFSGVVSENFEFFTNFNPILIFILTPMVAALTAEKNTYKMMILGTFVMGAPTFILALGPSITTVFAYLIIMTIGEAMWQPRFLQWVADIAPKGMTGIYMGIGQFPWFLTKIVTSLYSGWFLMKYCPAGVPPEQTHTETMWLIYGFIAIISPIGLWLTKSWMMKGFKVKADDTQPA